MRIQHNIMAMNAYRNYNTNTSSLSKNLEKLSSGYRINRAGDDAAGLAISEKMRAQITGLDAAQKNVKDGISLVKTAEGAMQEIQDMLNRMKYLATQSANGTYQDDVDREALQDEVDALTEEIDRIAQSANFNGQKLLDGSLGGGTSGAAGVPTVSGLELTDNAATKATQDVTLTAAGAGGANLTDGAVLSTTINYVDANGKNQSTTLKLTFDKANQKLVTEGGTEISLAANTHATAEEVGDALVAAAKENSSLSETFKISNTTGTLTFTAKTAGATTEVSSVIADFDATGVGNVSLLTTDPSSAQDAYQSIDMAHTAGNYTIGDVFTVGGKKFAFANTQDDAVALGTDVNVVVVGTPDQVDNDDVLAMADLIEQHTGYAPTVNGTTLQFKSDTTAGAAGKGLNLQIGDTGDSYNQLTVSISSMRANALGVDQIDVSTIDSAKAATDTIVTIINDVSATRGRLGAIQNRLEHTQNNLSVMEENIQDAESTIRDTDVADEMMAYTKNNILVQSAQAMLAQANAVPQGVLQLMQ